MGSDGIYVGKPILKRCVFRYFLKVATELAERTDSGRLFQRDEAQEWIALAPVLLLILGSDKLLSLFDLSKREGIDAGGIQFLFGFSFSLLVDIHDWTEAKHDCKPFSAATESPDAKETYSWLSSA